MLEVNKKTLDCVDDDMLIKLKKSFEKGLQNEELNDLQHHELEEMIKYIEKKSKDNNTKID